MPKAPSSPSRWSPFASRRTISLPGVGTASSTAADWTTIYDGPIARATESTTEPVSDILNVLRRRYPLARVLLAPTLVQGPEASAGIEPGVGSAGELIGMPFTSGGKPPTSATAAPFRVVLPAT